MTNQAHFEQAVAILEAKLAQMPNRAAPGVVMFALQPRLGAFVRKSGKKFLEVGLTYESRPGVWFHLGDQPQEVYQPILAALKIDRCSKRNDLGATNDDLLAFARQLVA